MSWKGRGKPSRNDFSWLGGVLDLGWAILFVLLAWLSCAGADCCVDC